MSIHSALRATSRSALLVAVLATVGLATVAAPVDAWAQDPAQAEKFRLQEEMKKLAQRNAWAGVEAKYQEMVALKVPLSFDDHFIGAQAARNLGKTFEMYSRLDRAREIEAKDEIIQEMEGILAAYGRIEIKGNPRKRPELAAVVMPFAPDERKSVEYAMEFVLNTGSFKGMLPAGEYTVGDQTFTVAAGQEFAVIEVGKSAGGQSADTRTGTIVYSGPVAMLGYNFLSSGAPETPPVDASAMQPDDLGGSGVALSVGPEIGFTKEFGVAVTVGYQGMYTGQDTLHNVNGWLAAAIRPGDLRIAAGPTFGIVRGSGVGVASWWDNPTGLPNEQFEYRGGGSAAGFQLTAGYGVFDVSDSLMGVVELGGAFQSDGARSYVGGGLRIGIVPMIQRFKG